MISAMANAGAAMTGSKRRFECRFAVGEGRVGYSSTWIVWVNKNDLYIANYSTAGEIKASVHAPRPPEKPEWRRQYSYHKTAVSPTARHAKLHGGPHKLLWPGCQIGPCMLECKIKIPNDALDDGLPVGDD